mmetsp:Transcript_958/g.3288  ORF Transcript_958/g.3288 Transcript_958/m.3288 type:complete len:85 (-) Transcript_958:483-737(-)
MQNSKLKSHHSSVCNSCGKGVCVQCCGKANSDSQKQFFAKDSNTLIVAKKNARQTKKATLLLAMILQLIWDKEAVVPNETDRGD